MPIVLGLGLGTPPGPPGLQEYTQSVRINHRNDGVTRVGGYWAVWGDNLYWVGAGDMTTALRFTGLSIPQGATVLEAKLSVWRASNMFGADANDYVDIGVEQVANPSRLSNLSDHSTRESNIGSTVKWLLGAGGIDTESQSPDLASIIQPVVNMGSWAGNIMFFSTSNSGTSHELETSSYETGGASTYPLLYVKWEA